MRGQTPHFARGMSLHQHAKSPVARHFHDFPLARADERVASRPDVDGVDWWAIVRQKAFGFCAAFNPARVTAITTTITRGGQLRVFQGDDFQTFRKILVPQFENAVFAAGGHDIVEKIQRETRSWQ